MGSIKLPHASGNSMSIAAPATNPASDLELKLPATIGTAGQVLSVDGSGNLVWTDNTPMWLVKLGSDYSHTSTNTWVLAPLAGEVFDTDNAFASNKFTVPSGLGGKYKITLNIYWSFGNTESASETQLHLYKNGSSVQREWISFNPTGRLSGSAQTLTMDMSLSASDYLEMYALGYTGGASIAAVDTQTRMHGFRIGT